ncbi:MAG: hypothetical protein V3U30_03720 [Thermoplasmata archaeon]
MKDSRTHQRDDSWEALIGLSIDRKGGQRFGGSLIEGEEVLPPPPLAAKGAWPPKKYAEDGHINPVDVLKVTHHGSEGGTGQTFVDAIRPKIAVVSSGNPSHEGHRFEQVIRDRLEGQPGVETEIRTTHESGDVVVRTDGRIVDIGGRRGILYELEVER